MNTYPQEYIVHSVPVLAVYGLNDQPSSPSTPRQHRPSSRASLGTTLATIFSSKQQYNVYESTRIQTHNSPGSPPFRVLFVDKVKEANKEQERGDRIKEEVHVDSERNDKRRQGRIAIARLTDAFSVFALRILHYLNVHQPHPTFRRLTATYHRFPESRHCIQMVS